MVLVFNGSSSLELPSHCFKFSVDDNFLVEEVKNWYKFKFYFTNKSSDPRFESEKQALKLLETTILHRRFCYSVDNFLVRKNFRI